MRDLNHLTIFVANLLLAIIIGMFVLGAVVLWAVGVLISASVIIAFFVMVFYSYRMSKSDNANSGKEY